MKGTVIGAIIFCVIVLIAAIVVLVVYFSKSAQEQQPQILDDKPRDPKPIIYSGKPITCTNKNLIKVTSFDNANNRTVYTIKSYPGMINANAISLSSGKPIRGFYDCSAQSNLCKMYKFITKSQHCTGKQTLQHYNQSENCIGGMGCHITTMPGHSANRYSYTMYDISPK